MRIVNASRHISVVPLGFWSYGDELVVPFGLIRQVSRNYWKDKTRQNAENKQTFDLTGRIEIMKNLVKTLKINKLLVCGEN